MSGAPGPDGRHDDLDADELAGLALLVPDDARSLDADRGAYLEELRARRGARPTVGGRLSWRRLAGGRFGVSGPVILLVLAAVAVVGSSLTIFSPSSGSGALLVAPIATNPPGDVGNIGGLLPDGKLTVDGIQVPLRSARPAMIVLVANGCQACGDALRSLLVQGREYNLPLVLAGPSSQLGELQRLNSGELGGSGLVVVDMGDVLAATYTPSGVSVVLVHEDGVVGAVIRDISSTQRLEPALAQLERPGAPTPAP